MEKKMKISLVLILSILMILFIVQISIVQENALFEKEPILILSGIAGNEPGEFGTLNEGDAHGPYDFVVDLNNDIWIMDVMNRRVQKFDPNGNFILEFPNEQNPTPIELITEYVECDPSGNIAIGPMLNGCMIILNNDSKYLRTIQLPNVRNTLFDFAINNLGELIYQYKEDTVAIDINGNVLYTIEKGPSIEGSHSSPYTAYINYNPKLDRTKIINSDVRKWKENVLTLTKEQLHKEGPEGIDKYILKIDPFGNLFVKTYIEYKNFNEIISYTDKNGKLIKNLKAPEDNLLKGQIIYRIYNIDKEGNFYMMEIRTAEGATRLNPVDLTLHGGETFLHLWKWERN